MHEHFHSLLLAGKLTIKTFLSPRILRHGGIATNIIHSYGSAHIDMQCHSFAKMEDSLYQHSSVLSLLILLSHLALLLLSLITLPILFSNVLQSHCQKRL